MAVLGLDLSLAATGISSVANTWTYKTKDTDHDLRLLHIYNMVQGEVSLLGPQDLVVLEDLPIHAMSAGITGMVQGVARLAIVRHGVPFVTVSPPSLKKFATGNGAAKKPQMLASVPSTVDATKWDDNAVDAYWCRRLGEELKTVTGVKYKRYDQYGRRVEVVK